MKNKADEPLKAPKPRTKRRGKMQFLLFPGGMTEDDVNKMQQTVKYELARLTSLALGRHKSFGLQNAAGEALAKIVAQIVKHQRKGFQDSFAKIAKENEGFKMQWDELGVQGERPGPHYPILRNFILDVEYVVAPPRIFSRVSESLLGIGLQAPPQDSLLDEEIHGPVDPNHLRRFERWAKLHLIELDAIKAEFSQVDCNCGGHPCLLGPDVKHPPCPQKPIRVRLIKELSKLPKKHFASYWDKIIEPAAKPLFAKVKSNPLHQEAALLDHPKCPKSFEWEAHKATMREMLEAAWRK
jgi:hypothetical protein